MATLGVLLLLSGCYGGGSDILNPVMELTFPAGTSLPAWDADVVLVVEGSAKTADANNPVTSYEWTQVPANAGTFTSTTTFGTTWKSRALALGEVSNVTLTLTAKTKLGGKTSMPLNLIVTP
jgi:hypothetical protein